MDRKKNLYFSRNAMGVASVEFFWGLGFPIVLESTFLQLFLKQLGASGFIIGIVPALFIFCSSCLPVFAGYLTRNVRYKKKVVILVHIIPAIAIFLLGCTMLLVKEVNVLVLYFAYYSVFSMALGFGIPVWLNFLARIFSEAKTVPGLGYMMLAQNIAKIISSFFILKVVERYAFSTASCGVVFLLTGTVFIIGALFFSLTVEFAEKGDPEPSHTSFVAHTRQALGEILANRPFLVYLAADLDFYIVLTTLSFYANYATQHYGVNQAVAAGLFVGCIYAGSITVNILLGTLNLLTLKQKFILSKCTTAASLLLLITVPGSWSFFLISYLLGMARAIRNMVYTPAVKKLSGRTDATDYFALAPLITAPVGFGFPLLFGKMLDLLSGLGTASYQILFAISAIFLFVTFWFTARTQFAGTGSSLVPARQR